MVRIGTVLCPVDFTDLARREVALAADVCRAFGARLRLHHNLDVAPPGMTRVWEWNELEGAGKVGEVEAERRLRALIAELPPALAAQASLSGGSIGAVLVELARTLPADLVVLGSHGCSTMDHASLTERMIDDSPVPVLTLEEGAHLEHFHLGTGGAPRTVMLAPTDLSAAAAPLLEYAVDLADQAPLDLHVLHVLPRSSRPAAVEQARRDLRIAARADRSGATCHVELGEPVEAILRCSEQVSAGFLLMGEHARGLLRRLFTRDVARAILHRASCPVWFVPAGR